MNPLVLAAAVAIAGGAGAAVRHAVDVALPGRSRLPWALLVINSTGSLALGLLIGAGADGSWAVILGAGFLGGYTTFSAASGDAARRWVTGAPGAAIASAVMMLMICVASAVIGMSLAR